MLLLLLALPALGAVDDHVIHLRPHGEEPRPEPQEEVRVEEPRTGFDYEAFESQLESLWFQRKTLLADARVQDAAQQLQRIRAFAAEEGVRRLEHIAGALAIEARRYLDEGNHEQALSAIQYASEFDPDNPRLHLLRARVHWDTPGGRVASCFDFLRAFRAALLVSLRELSLFHRIVFVFGLSLFAAVLVFSLLMLVRHQVPLRHEIHERLGAHGDAPWARPVTWAVLALPALSWFALGWAPVYWMLVTFRFMTRAERITTIVLLLALAAAWPAYGVAVGLYGTTADPAVRTTLASMNGEYDPDRIVKLRQLVDAHPDDPVYRFLLAGLYKNGRHFEDAFREYKQALSIDPTLAPAYINIGNIFYMTGQHAEALANYRRAIELDPGSFLAYFDMHLAQSEDFRFRAAEESLREARRLDANRVAELLAGSAGWEERPQVVDASLNLASVWEAALSGRRVLRPAGASGGPTLVATPPRILNPITIVSLGALLACLLLAWRSRRQAVAKRCIRCGRPFCHRCKSGREAHEYCSQCLHLFVLGDGLAPGTKSKKLYEVERHERIGRRSRRLLSMVCPGAGQILRGRTGWGFVLLLLWSAALIVSQGSILAVLGRFVGAELRSELWNGSSGGAFGGSPVALAALLTLPLLWTLGNAWRWRRREV